MPKTKATRSESTPTKAGVTFSDTTTSTPATYTSLKTETPSGSLIDAAEDICFTETLNKIFSKKLLAILTGKDEILKEVRDLSYDTTLTDYERQALTSSDTGGVSV